MSDIDHAREDKLVSPTGELALRRMQVREEVLQICYWYLGEGLGQVLNHRTVQPFLTCSADEITDAFAALVADGDFVQRDDSYEFTEQGQSKAARMFADTFTEFQLASHYECTAGCCDGEEVCDHADKGHVGHGHG